MRLIDPAVKANDILHDTTINLRSEEFKMNLAANGVKKFNTNFAGGRM
jgi:hypothetical protein